MKFAIQTKLFCSLLWGTLVFTCLSAQAQTGRENLPLQGERGHGADILHYRIALTFSPANRSFRGETVVRFAARHKPLRMLELDAETFTVSKITDGGGAPLAFRHADGTLRIVLRSPLQFKDTTSVTVFYSAENVDIESEKFGMPASYDLGIDFKNATDENPALVNTLSFPQGARHWFPCYDHPNDKATQETILTVPARWTAISNGVLQGVREGSLPDTRTFHWKMSKPHSTYLAVIAAGPYVAVRDSLNGLPLTYWVYPQDEPDAMRSFGRTPEIMAFFEAMYDNPYPWQKYDQITIPGIGGGAESTGATVVGHSTIHDERADQDFSSHWLVAHEAAHQWFGDLVTARDWSETWLNESFATYGEYRWARYSLGAAEGAVNMRAKHEAYLREAAQRYRRPIVSKYWRYPNDNFDRHTYQKGAAVLHMLAGILGERRLDAAASALLHKHAFGSVDTHDFLDAIKETTGEDVAWFFEQWLYSPGHPVLDVSSAWSAGSNTLVLKVEQKQDTTDGVPVFRLPVDMLFHVDGRQERKSIEIRERVETFEFLFDVRPQLVRFDAGNRLIRELTFRKSVDALIYQLQHDDPIGRAWAAAELGPAAGQAGVRAALRRASVEDPFWDPRRAAIAALASAADSSDAEFFARRRVDSHSRVREAAMRALGALQLERMVDFLLGQYHADDSYVVQAAILRGLAYASAKPQVRSLLEEAAQQRSPRDVIARAARTASAAGE